MPGRALLVTLNWSKETKLTVLAVYAPNTKRQRKILGKRREFANNRRLLRLAPGHRSH